MRKAFLKFFSYRVKFRKIVKIVWPGRENNETKHFARLSSLTALLLQSVCNICALLWTDLNITHYSTTLIAPPFPSWFTYPWAHYDLGTSSLTVLVAWGGGAIDHHVKSSSQFCVFFDYNLGQPLAFGFIKFPINPLTLPITILCQPTAPAFLRLGGKGLLAVIAVPTQVGLASRCERKAGDGWGHCCSLQGKGVRAEVSEFRRLIILVKEMKVNNHEYIETDR